MAYDEGGNLQEGARLSQVKSRIRLRFSGIVQGVGFRPFVYRTALSHGMAGFVRNDADGVTVEAEGAEGLVDAFVSSLLEKTPPLAEIHGVLRERVPPLGEKAFRIVASDATGRAEALISPDVATCDACLAELFDPSNRRYRYPFINCTDCGPRLTIVEDVPYDRERTSMSVFPMCEQCRKEFEDPGDRRFHAQPNACPVCGPRLTLVDREGRGIRTDDPLAWAANLIREGGILAVKGLGGFHLCVNALYDKAVARLRERKCREEKALAVMARDLATAERLVHLGEEERRLLRSPSRPIVICREREVSPVSRLVAPSMGTLGVMLPYTPLHHLILEKDPPVLVMTSANLTDEPICIDNEEAVERLKDVADAFVLHNRDIVVRCDDSVAIATERGPTVVRRSRGYAPRPVLLGARMPEVLALGAHLKSTVCVVRDDLAFLSPHVGDLETPLARDFFLETVETMQRIARCRPGVLACDMHPDYFSTRYALGKASSAVIRVQHHHAHIVSCMAENRLKGPVIGLAMDGTGYGEDSTIWGGEFLIATETAFERAGHLACVALPGGEAAVRQPWRTGASLLRGCFGEEWREIAGRLGLVPAGIDPAQIEALLRSGLNCPVTSSLGRLFDGVSSILGLCRRSSYEGQAAIVLEACADRAYAEVLPFVVDDTRKPLVVDLSAAVRKIVERRLSGEDASRLASAFHATVVEALAGTAVRLRGMTGIGTVVLSGGCFQNRLLLQGCASRLEGEGFSVATHARVPPNDGGISLGQAVVAASRLAYGKV